MKALYIIIFLFLTLNLSSNELAWVDEQINAIKPPRKGVSNFAISRLRDPFLFLKKKTEKNDVQKATKNGKSAIPDSTATSLSSTSEVQDTFSRTAFRLSAIMNHSALINGKWYKLNEKINGYTLSRISISYVVLSKKGKNVLLTTNSTNMNIKFKNK